MREEVPMATPTTAPAFSALLESAVSDPGIISAAYSQFHSYSLGNVLLAAFQCPARGLPLGPLATYPKWQALGRQVRKGEKALTLCQPVTVRAKAAGTDNAEPDADGPVFVRFVYRPAWSVLSQTDGADLQPGDLPTWGRARALAALDITEIPFEHHAGTLMGYARSGRLRSLR